MSRGPKNNPVLVAQTLQPKGPVSGLERLVYGAHNTRSNQKQRGSSKSPTCELNFAIGLHGDTCTMSEEY